MANVFSRFMFFTAVAAVLICPSASTAGERDTEREARKQRRETEKEYDKAVREAEREHRKAADEDAREAWKDAREAEREYGKDIREREREAWKEAREAEREGHKDGHIGFGRHDVEIIIDFFRKRPRAGNTLPPGIEKQIRRGRPLPPGLRERVEPLPPDLERQLPGVPLGTRRGRIGSRVVVYDPKTAAVLDAVEIAGEILRQ